MLRQLDSKVTLKEKYEEEAAEARAKAEKEMNKLADMADVKEIFLAASKKSQSQVFGLIEKVVTSALQSVFGPELVFKVESVERRNSIEADVVLYKNGKEVDIMGNSGGSVANVIAIALRAGFIVLNGASRRFMVLDEPTSGVGAERQPLVGNMLKVLSDKFGFQIVVTTHSVPLAKCGDKIYHISMKNEKAKVRLITDKDRLDGLMDG